MGKLRILCGLLFCLFLCSCGKQGVTLPELTPEKLDSLYQEEFDKYSDNLPGEVHFDFESLSLQGQIYTACREGEIDLVHSADIPSNPWEKSLADYPLEKLCDVYGEVFVKPVYGDLNADGQYADVYAWYDDASKVEGECLQGTIWKFGEYDTSHLVALTKPEEDEQGRTVYRLTIFYHLNDIRMETGKDLLLRILNPMNADRYGVIGQPDALQTLSGEKPEDVFFLGGVYQGTVVTEKEIKDPNLYSTVLIHEKEPYNRNLYFRDYGDGIVGYCTPEGTMVYVRVE